MQKRIKSLLPSLKEKKRYLAYKIIMDDEKTTGKNTAQELTMKIMQKLGAFESSEAGMMPIESNPEKMAGIIRISNAQIFKAKATLALIEELNGSKVIVSSIITSGMLNRARHAVNTLPHN